MVDFVKFTKILNSYCLKTIDTNVPEAIAINFYKAYLKACLRKRINAEDFIKGFFIYIGKGKGLFIDKKA